MSHFPNLSHRTVSIKRRERERGRKSKTERDQPCEARYFQASHQSRQAVSELVHVTSSPQFDLNWEPKNCAYLSGFGFSQFVARNKFA